MEERKMAYSIKHVTDFRYEPEARESLMEVRMQPRSDARQRCLTFSLDVSPQADIMSYQDFLGNTVHHFDIPGRQKHIQVTAQAIVEVREPPAIEWGEILNWDGLDTRVGAGDYWDMLLPSTYAKPTDLLHALERELKVARTATPIETLLELNAGLYRAFEYAPNSTQVDSPIDDALRTRRGVCQDFAHIMIALVRGLRIPCRYVSGYLHRADKKKKQHRSADGATHAWVEAFLPDLGWVAFDPTNNLTGTEKHIAIALGRDYGDVPPTRGVYKGGGESELSVQVTVTQEDSPEPQNLRPATVIRRVAAPASGSAESFQEQQQQQQQ
jgi:transglutaminase-like putative cysteine protease